MGSRPINLAALREDYVAHGLRRADLDPDPIKQFSKWFDEAAAAQIRDVNAMCLSTVKADGSPASRVVLLKGTDQRGLVFYTNYTSAKANETGAESARGAQFFLGATRAPDSNQWRDRKNFAQGIGGIFCVASDRESARRVGFATKRSDSKSRCARRKISGSDGAFRRRPGSVAGKLGRLSCRAGHNRVLARSNESSARSFPLFAPRRRQLDYRAALALIGCANFCGGATIVGKARCCTLAVTATCEIGISRQPAKSKNQVGCSSFTCTWRISPNESKGRFTSAFLPRIRTCAVPIFTPLTASST